MYRHLPVLHGLMSNSYFDFKQFRIEQGRSAMKMSTDACIQGAWTPVPPDAKYILDIGTGTGLLALMLAQRNANVQIDAIELDAEAAQDAQHNFGQSSFADRLQVFQGDVKIYPFQQQYDFIITNPPFFANSLLGPHAARNTARHGLSLSLEELLQLLDKLLTPTGSASVLLPATEHQHWAALLQSKDWSLASTLHIIPKPDSKANRVVSIYTRSPTYPPLVDELLIRDKLGNYTPEFIRLLNPFYLNL